MVNDLRLAVYRSRCGVFLLALIRIAELDILIVPFDIILTYGVSDFFTICIAIQICEGIGPAILLAQCE